MRAVWNVRAATVVRTLFVTLAGSWLAPASAQEASALQRRFLSEAPVKWRAYEAWAQRLQGTIDTTYRVTGPAPPAGNPAVMKTHKSILQNEQCSRFDTFSFIEGRLGAQATVVNDRYAFVCARDRPDDGDWRLSGMEMGTDGVALSGVEKPIRQLPWMWVGLHFHIQGIPLESLVREKHFRITGTKTEIRSGRELMIVEFEAPRVGNKANRYNPLQSGQLVLDPDRDWCLRGYQMRGKWTDGSGEVAVEFNTRDDPAGHPVLVSMHRVLTRAGDPVGVDELFEFTLQSPTRLPGDEQFCLTAFGLPEPPGITAPSRPTPTYVWLLIAAGILGVVALACRWLLKRRAKAVPPPPPATA